MAQKNRFQPIPIFTPRFQDDAQRMFDRIGLVLNDKVAYLDADAQVFTGSVQINPGPLIVGVDPGGTQILRVGDDVLVKGSDATNNGLRLDVHNISTATHSFGVVQVAGNNGVVTGQIMADGLGTSPLGVAGMYVGTFSAHILGLVTGNVERWRVTTAGHLLAKLDNTYDIGATGATRPKDIFLAGILHAQGGEVRLDHAGNAHLEFYIGGVRKAGVSVIAADVLRFTDSAGTVKLQFNLGGTAGKIIPPSTSLTVRNNADSADNLAIADAGDVTVRNNLTVSGTSATLGANAGGSANFTLNAAAATLRQILFQSATSNRWIIRVDNAAESGGDAGSALVIVARDDAGNAIDNVLVFVRAAGGTITVNRQAVFNVDVGTRYNNHTNGAGAAAGTLLNAPAAGNPAFWLPVSIAGTTRHIPCW